MKICNMTAGNGKINVSGVKGEKAIYGIDL
jgi:hypothetical protein